jgi:hypothetical protein
MGAVVVFLIFGALVTVVLIVGFLTLIISGQSDKDLATGETEPEYPTSSTDTGQRSRPSTLAKREVAQ